MKMHAKILVVSAVLALPLTACSGTNEHMDDGHSHNETSAPMTINMTTEAKNVEAVLTS